MPSEGSMLEIVRVRFMKQPAHSATTGISERLSRNCTTQRANMLIPPNNIYSHQHLATTAGKTTHPLTTHDIAFISRQLPRCFAFHKRRLARYSGKTSPCTWLVRRTGSPDVHMVDWTQLFRAVSATCFFPMASRHLYGSERRLCRDDDVFAWICLLSQKSIVSISLWFLYIERVVLKLPTLSGTSKPGTVYFV